MNLEHRPVLVTGGSRGLGLGIVEALVERKAQVTVVARDRARLADVERRLGVRGIAGDVTDRELATSIVNDVRPHVLILNAGIAPPMGPVHELSWEAFTAVWDTDVKAGLHWIQAAIRLPLPPGGRVLLGSSGAALNGSPLSGGYAGAKRMLWLMAIYANGVAEELDLGIRFQVAIPQQMVGNTGVGDAGARAYAARKGIAATEFLAGFGKPMPPREYGESIATLLTDPKYENAVAVGFKGDTGITVLDR